MRAHPLLLAAGLLLPLPVAAEGGPPAAPPAAAAATAEDPVVARVDGAPLRLSDVLDAAEDVLPAELRAMPPAELARLLPPDLLRQLTERAITERALVNAARARGLDKDPEVRARIRRAEEQELQQALLSREVGAEVTEAALRARYEQDIARRPAEEEVHARHILVRTETEARQALTELRAGADFAEVAKRRSTGPGAESGGDLGFFKRGDMVPKFAEAAFALRPGETSQAPVRSPFGWHVIRVEARRTAPVPSFEDVREALRQRLVEERVNAAVQRIRAEAKVERLDQAPARSLLDNAAPPPAAPQSPAQPQRR